MCTQPRPCRTRAAWLTITAAAALVLLAAATPARAAEVHIGVRADGSIYEDEFTSKYGTAVTTTIAAAITSAQNLIAADSTATVTIHIAAGTYSEHLVLDARDAITLKGHPATAPYDVVINSDVNTQPAIEINGIGSGIALEGITCTGGSAGIDISTGNNATVTIDRCYVIDNNGPGILCKNAAVTITNCPIAGNRGDGIRAEGSAQVTVTHCSVIRNGGNGINQSTTAATVAATNCLVYQNGYGQIQPANFELSTAWNLQGEWQAGIPQGKGGAAFGNPDPGPEHGRVFGVDLGLNSDDGDYDVTTGSRQVDNTTEVSLPAAATTSSAPITISNADSFAPQTVEIKNLKIDLTAFRRLKAILVDSLGNNTALFSGIGGDAVSMGPTWLHNGAATSIMSPLALPPYADPAGYSPQQPFTAPASNAGDWTLQLNVDPSTNDPVVLSSPSWNHSEWNPAWTAHPDGDSNYGRGPADTSNISLYRGGTSTSVANPMLLGDYTYTVNVRISPGLPDSYEFGVVFRSDPTGANCFKFLISGSRDFSNVLQTEAKLIRTVGGVDTVLWSDTRPIKLTPGMITGFGVTCAGSSIQPFVNLPGIGPITAPEYSDTSPLRKGTVGLTMSNSPDLANIVTFVRAELDAADVATPGTLHSWSLYFGAPYKYLTSPALPTTGYTGIKLNFARWLNQDAKADSVIEWSTDATTWNRLDTIAGVDTKDNAWQNVSYSLPAAAENAPALQVRWGYRTEQTGQPASGWNIRDIRFIGISGSNYGVAGTAAKTSLSGNYVYDNVNDYESGLTTTADVDVLAIGNPDLRLSNSPFIGKVLDQVSPLFGRAVASSVPISFTYIPRPTPSTIGADEPTAGGINIYVWDQCIIKPNPCKRLSAGELFVSINCTGTLDTTLHPPYISCESGEEIKLRPEGTSSNGYYEFTNVDPIESTAEYIVDGHGVLYLLDGTSTGAPIQPYGQAVTGRNVLIDTIPPVVVDEPRPWIVGAQIPPYAAAHPGVIWGTAPAVNAGGGISVPYELPTGIILPQTNSSILNDNTGPHAPLRNMGGEITYFYNTGSVSNNYDGIHDGLRIVVHAQVHDLDTFELFGKPHRTVSGFANTTLGDSGPAITLAAQEAEGVNIPLSWQVSGITLPAIEVNSIAPDPEDADVTISFVGPISDSIVTGSGDAVKFGGKFIARDLAGNTTVVPDLPIQIWWDLEADTKVRTFNENANPYPTVEWEAPKPAKNVPITSGAPAPLAFFHVWYSLTPGEPGKAGSYQKLTPDWQALYDDADGVADGIWRVPSTYFKTLADNNPICRGRWVAVVVGMMDECGNVSEWPADLAYTNANQIEVFGDPATPNWCLAYIGSRASELDTSLSAIIEYQNPDGGSIGLGPATLVAYPPAPAQVGAVFTITPIAPRFGDLNNPYVQLELDRDGTTVWRASRSINSTEQFRVTLPYDAFLMPDVNNLQPDGASFENKVLGDPDRKLVAGHTFRATFYAEINGEQIFDPTPATFFFQIVPGSVEQYLKASRGEQPIKSTESVP